MDTDQLARLSDAPGFIAALDQSGGSTPGALRRYGLDESSYADEARMFDLVHAMRTRIITSPAFDSRVVAAILFEQTMDRTIGGLGAAEYLWLTKRIVPILKIDKGLAAEEHGVRLMAPIPGLEDLLTRAVAHGVGGTKMRSLVVGADPAAIDAVVGQQLEVARTVLGAGLVPIVEPEVDIHSPTKGEAERLLLDALLTGLGGLEDLAPGARVMLKLTLPEQDGLWTPLVDHPRVVRVAALSGGYSRDEACARLARNPRVVASFSRALTEGLTAQQDDATFDAALDASIEQIYRASTT